jgi:serine/threonine protein kinase
MNLTLKKVVFLMIQVSQAIRFLHMHKIVHLDLKPENILILKNLMIKIVDFGESYHPAVGY